MNLVNLRITRKEAEDNGIKYFIDKFYKYEMAGV